jgi:sec-independent protein translocase protein TatC
VLKLFTHRSAGQDQSFFDHLDTLRYALMRVALVLLVAAVIVFLNGAFLYEVIILGPREPGFLTNRLFCELGHWLEIPILCINTIRWNDVNLELAGQFRFHISLSLQAALILIIPYIIAEVWWFVKPALYPAEQKKARGFILITSGLFYLGALFGYYLIMPLAVNFLASYELHPAIDNMFQLSSYIKILATTVLSAGIVFEMPVLIYFLTRVGLITPAFLRQYRKHVFVVLLILSAIITPPDVLSQFLVVVPLYLLFELGVKVASSTIEASDNQAST